MFGKKSMSPMTIQSKSNKTGGPYIMCRFDRGKSGLLCSFILRKARINIEFLMTHQVTHSEIYLFKYFLPVYIVEIFIVSPVFQDLDPTTKWKQNWKTSSKFIS